MTDDERLERALGIDGDRTFYVEARVGSENHRGKCCRVLWRDARNNEPADELIPLLVAEVRRLRAAALAERGRVWAAVRDAVQAGERLGTFGPALPYEQVSARLDAIARGAADRIEAVLGAIRRGPEPTEGV